jgi:hypothetical protein
MCDEIDRLRAAIVGMLKAWEAWDGDAQRDAINVLRDLQASTAPGCTADVLIGNADHDSSREVCEQCGHSWDDHTEMFTDTEVWYQCPPSGILLYDTDAVTP